MRWAARGWVDQQAAPGLRARPPAAVAPITAGQRGDSPQFAAVLDRIRVARRGSGRLRTRPDRVLADKAYSARRNRAYLRRRKIRTTIPVKDDQAASRRKLGSRGCRPPAFDPEVYKQRHAVECGISITTIDVCLRALERSV